MEKEKYYLTKEGLQKLKREYEELQKIKALKTRGEVPDILHSEEVNPEYLAYQQDIGLIEMRLSELENIFKKSEIINEPPAAEKNIVHLGATVLVEVDGRPDEFTIVGSLEANPSFGRISNESPVGKALMGRKVGEAVLISSPIQITYKIKKIKYEF